MNKASLRHVTPTPDIQPLQTPAIIERDPATVIQGSTQPMAKETVRLLFTFSLLFVTALASLAAYYASAISHDLALVVFLLVFGLLSLITWRMTMIVASGNFAARIEIRQRTRLELKKMQQAHTLHLRQLSLQAQRDRYLYEIEHSRIVTDQELQELRIELATARHQERIARNAIGEIVDTPSGAPISTPKGYIAPATNPIRQTVIDYLFGDGHELGLYRYNGQPNPDWVDLTTGRLINHTVPWSTRGPLKSIEARRTARTIVQPQAHEPLIYYQARDKSWYLNLAHYPDAEAAQVVIGGY